MRAEESEAGPTAGEVVLWTELPAEMWMLVFEFIPEWYRPVAAGTCRKWRDVAKSLGGGSISDSALPPLAYRLYVVCAEGCATRVT